MDPAEQEPSDWETVTDTVQSAVPDTVDGVRPEKSLLVSEPVTLHVTLSPSETVEVNVELSVALAAREKFELTVL